MKNAFTILLEKLLEAGKDEAVTAPTKPIEKPFTPVKPSTPSRPGKEKHRSPISPGPGVHPQPKGVKNLDIELFKKARSSVVEAAPSFVHPTKQAWIKTGDEELNALLPSLTTDEHSYLETITGEAYQDMIKRLEKYTNQKAEDLKIPQLLSLVLQTLQKVLDVEHQHKDYLEKLALDLIMELPEFKLVKKAYENKEVDFDIKLGTPELDLDVDTDAEEGELSQAEEVNLDLATELEGLSDEKLRRRLANLLMQGTSTLKLYLFNLVSDKLAAIDPSLPNDYGILAVITQLGYWMAPTGIEKFAGGAPESQMGSEEVIPEGDDYIIKVRALTFPFLIHELVKGIYEWVAIDPELKKAMQSDTIEKETKDIIVGPELSKILNSYVSVEKQELLPLVYKKFLQLPKSEVKEVFAKSIVGKKVMQDLVFQAEDEWKTFQQEEKEEITSEYQPEE